MVRAGTFTRLLAWMTRRATVLVIILIFEFLIKLILRSQLRKFRTSPWAQYYRVCVYVEHWLRIRWNELKSVHTGYPLTAENGIPLYPSLLLVEGKRVGWMSHWVARNFFNFLLLKCNILSSTTKARLVEIYKTCIMFADLLLRNSKNKSEFIILLIQHPTKWICYNLFLAIQMRTFIQWQHFMWLSPRANMVSYPLFFCLELASLIIFSNISHCSFGTFTSLLNSPQLKTVSPPSRTTLCTYKRQHSVQKKFSVSPNMWTSDYWFTRWWHRSKQFVYRYSYLSS